ncbi:transcriptional regulator [Hoeflea marina]|uniref:Transcriptional regulator n=1 Tax=Hoeflea marina TaxID=274592 RepID=A0A317PIU1_9HYPH|nr:LysR substrate-binding domain-containing protein [Hoeflea marina]PWW00363.1 transcriptional regulator [Hoeflea marina]
MTQSRLPPLATIRVFEAAARHLSFTRAAAELGMTQAAVSYQIRVLEERVGQPLFLRRPRQVSLTPAGARLAPQLSEAFGRLGAAFDELSDDIAGTLLVNTVQTFASHWLASRIGHFQLSNPALAIRLESASELIDFRRHQADVAIRSGRGDWPGLISHRLFELTFTPMLSPALAETIGGLATPADILRLPIIDATDPWWRIWFSAAGLDPKLLDGRVASQMGAQAVEAQVAIAGTGVAMLTPEFHREELARGRLLQPFDIVGRSGGAYWLVYPEGRRNLPRIRRFRDWILAEAGRA